MPWLRENIDTNRNNQIDISSQCNEINNFILDKNKWEQNLNELWNHLNNLGRNFDNLWIKDAINRYFLTPERKQLEQWIKNKIGKDESLTKKELSLLYIKMLTEWNEIKPQDLKFDSKQPIDKICNWTLISYIRTKYNSLIYTWKNAEIKPRNQQNTKPSTNPLGRPKESQKIWWNVELPQNIWEIKESEADFYCNRLITRAEQNFPNEISKAKREIENRHRYKNDNEKKAYIKYDTLLIAFEKYTEIVSKKHDTIIHQSWYNNKEEFENQSKLMESFQKDLQEKFPQIDDILQKIKQFWEEIKTNERKYFKDENETKNAEKNYKEFNEYVEIKTKEYNIDWIKDSINKDPENKNNVKEYLHNMNRIFSFQQDILEKNQSYGDSIQKYQKYLKWAIDIQNKYNIQQYNNILEKYNQNISNWNKVLDFKKYESYTSLLQSNWKITNGYKNISTLRDLIINQKSKWILVKEFKWIEQAQQIKQERTDAIWNTIKKINPTSYWMLTSFVWLRNWLIEATIWAWTWLWAMILWIIWWKNEALTQIDRKEKRDNFLKIWQSSTQKEQVYNPETWFNFNADNTVTTVASSISQMYTLIYWWWAMAKWATKAFWIWEKIAWRVWLFSNSFIMQVWWSYQEAITSWLSWWEALWYGMLSATVQSWLELISPNEVLLWKWNWIVKELIKNACKSWSKESFKMIWKTFMKNVWMEIFEENIQESLQAVAWNLINMAANWTFWSELWADWSWKNFTSTAIITTLTTWITTWTSTWLQMNNLSSQDKTKLIEHIKNDQWTYIEVTEMIDKAIAWKIKIPNVNIQQLQDLKWLLSINETTWNTDYFNWKSKKLFEGNGTQARWNSEMMDNLLNEIKKEWITKTEITEKLEELRKEISEQYKKSTWEELQLTDEQLLSILDAHEQDWKLWELTLWQLRQKVKVLDDTITDPKVRRFLLEAWFCGQEKFDTKTNVEHLEGLWIKIPSQGIEKINNLKLDFEKLWKIRDLWVEITQYNIEKLNNIEWLDFEKLMEIKNLWANINSYDIEYLNEFDSTDINEIKSDKNIKNFRELWISIDLAYYYHYSLDKQNFDFNKIEIFKDLNIIEDEIHQNDIFFLSWLSEVTDKKLSILKKITDLWIKPHIWNVNELCNEDIKIENIERLVNLWFKLDVNEIIKINKMKMNFDNLKFALEKQLIKTNWYLIEKLEKINSEDFSKIIKLINLGIKIDSYDCYDKFDKIKNMNINFTKIENFINNYWFAIYLNNIENFNNLKISKEELIQLKKHWINTYYEITQSLEILKNLKKQSMKDFTRRKNEYLNSNRTLSEQKFQELFWFKTTEDWKKITWKYWKTEINQRWLGLCYAYTWFELLKKTNWFNELIQTNLREITEWWEVRMPIWDKNGEWIKINKNEIDKKYTWINSKWKEETFNINSESELLWFKILEIAYMKNYIIKKYFWKKSYEEYLKNDIEKAYSEYRNNWDFNLTWNLILSIEWGNTLDFMWYILPDNYYSTSNIFWIKSDLRDLAFDFYTKGLYKIEVSIKNPDLSESKNVIPTETEKYWTWYIVDDARIIYTWKTTLESRFNYRDGKLSTKENDNNKYSTPTSPDIVTNNEWKKAVMFFKAHAYSIERCYIDKRTWEKRVRIINPRHTWVKFDISLKQCKSIFSRTVIGININNMFH